jgi:ABC-2 type transport system permease protein
MLAIGMVASFLTSNLTVGFVLGAMFNAPLAFAESMPDWPVLRPLKQLSIGEQFRDFASGVISFASVGYFLAIVAVMLYLSVVLIGRRHWRGGAEGNRTMLHYLVRFGALALVVICLNVFLTRHDTLRADVTSEGLNSLAPETRELIKNLKPAHPITIEYFVSPTVPETYVQTRLNLLSTLREIQALGGDKFRVIGHEVEPFSEDATIAEQQYGIVPVPVEGRARGTFTRDEIFMGLAISSGLDKIVIPFLDRGIPAEYELVRSIATVAQEERKKLGVLQTDAQLFASFNMQTMTPGQNQQIIEELQKQYDVVQVDPSKEITEKFDVLLAVQPSSLGPDQMKNFIAAVKSGQRTAIFEDPFPLLNPSIPGTAAPKMPPGGANPFMQQQQQPEPKGDIRPLWQLLGVEFDGDTVVWQDYNPIVKLPDLPPEWVFVDSASGATEPFNLDSPITRHLQQVLYLFPGSMRGLNTSSMKFERLVNTNNKTGTIRADQIMQRSFMGPPQFNPDIRFLRKRTGESYILAAQIRGKAPKDDISASEALQALPGGHPPVNVPMSDQEAKVEEKAAPAEAPAATQAEATKSDDAKPNSETSDAGKAAETSKSPAEAETQPAAEPKKNDEINVVLVADIDCLYGEFFSLRARGSSPTDEIEFQFDNVPFVLNVLDVLAQDDRFVEIRTRRPLHRSLEELQRSTAGAREKAAKAREQFQRDFDNAQLKAQKEFEAKIDKLRQREGINQQQAAIDILAAQQQGQRELDVKLETLRKERDESLKSAQRELDREVHAQQDWYKLWAVLLPPIPPLIVGLIVFFNRRAREREGVSRARLR